MLPALPFQNVFQPRYHRGAGGAPRTLGRRTESAEEGDEDKAEKEYHMAIEYNPSYPEPHKGLGIVYYKRGEKERAKANFEKYLFLAPDAKDKAYIEQYLRNME